MSKIFKAGDKIKRVDYSYERYGMFVGHVYTVDTYNGGELTVKEIPHKYWDSAYFELVEEPILFGKQLFGHKIKVKDKEQSRLIQEAVFEAGGGWPNRNKTLDLRSKFLWVSSVGEITHLNDNDEEFFIKEKTPELILETVKSLRIVETIPVKSQADIDKEDIQKVIDKLQEDLDNAKQQLNSIGGNLDGL